MKKILTTSLTGLIVLTANLLGLIALAAAATALGAGTGHGPSSHPAQHARSGDDCAEMCPVHPPNS
jgi:hypothetical protein